MDILVFTHLYLFGAYRTLKPINSFFFREIKLNEIESIWQNLKVINRENRISVF